MQNFSLPGVVLVLALAMNWSNAPSREPRSPEAGRETSSGKSSDTGRVLEIRSYNLKPGTRDQFHHLFLEECLPLLQKYQLDVVAYGPSLHDADSYFLMRSYPSAEERERSEDEFYGSDDWKKGPREAILADIENYTTVVVPVDAATLGGLRKLKHP